MSNQSCVLSIWFNRTLIDFQFSTYFIISPINFLCSLSIHIIFLLAFYRQSKKERTYIYQIYHISIESLEILAFFLYTLSGHWCSDSYSTEKWWCTKNYWIMWYGNHLSFQLLNGLTTTKLLISLAMSTDRLLAIAKPIFYKNLNHKFYSYLALCLSLSLGTGTSIFDCFRYSIEKIDQDFYEVIINDRFVASLEGEILSILRNILRFTCLITLLIFNLLIIKVYRQYALKVCQIESKQKKEKIDEKTLTLLTISQSILTSIDIAFYIFFHTLRYFAPDFMKCRGQILEPALDTVVQLTGTLNLYLVLSISRSVREMVIKVVMCKKSIDIGLMSRVGPLRANE